MMNWIRNLFGRLDRGDVAAERIAIALEQMADDVEAARDALRGRLGIEAKNEEAPAIEAGKNGKRSHKVTI